MRSALCSALLAGACLLVMSAPAAAQQPAPGFTASLIGEGIAEPASPECHVSGRSLWCWFVGKIPEGTAGCSFGGRVPTVRLTARGRARQTSVCMDEAFHDWKRLAAGRSWRSGRFTCRHIWRGEGVGRHTELACRNGRHGFRVRPDGSMRRN